jgi:hypothetical protein
MLFIKVKKSNESKLLQFNCSFISFLSIKNQNQTNKHKWELNLEGSSSQEEDTPGLEGHCTGQRRAAHLPHGVEI